MNKDPSESDTKKSWKKRPENWISIAEDAEIHGNMDTLLKYKIDFAEMSDTAAYRRLYKWKTDLKNHKPPNYFTRIPAYGRVIDDSLLTDFNSANASGSSVDNEFLRRSLILHLEAANLGNLLIENGGSNTFGASWAARFCKRHNVGPRKRAVRGTVAAAKELLQKKRKIEMRNLNSATVTIDEVVEIQTRKGGEDGFESDEVNEICSS